MLKLLRSRSQTSQQADCIRLDKDKSNSPLNDCRL